MRSLATILFAIIIGCFLASCDSSSGKEAALADTDNDSIPDSIDEDDDGDGILDTEDPFPLDGSRPTILVWSEGKWDEVTLQ